ncbi:mycofactocin precursor MftA [Rubrobacter xylanophilus]|uniref:mycofactocin precursor MftA n=1 Tax=Rubrobacter xylanophilus TaxID=49319 RepID=UPI0002DAE5CF|nr:mycofactocin precursor MftA [Rubrobacter xylanophilus]
MDNARDRSSATASFDREEGRAQEPGRRQTSGAPRGEDGVEEEILIEEISIDGMCGVY